MITFANSVDADEMQHKAAFHQGICSWYMYITHFYCLAVEGGFYSDVVECLPLDPAAQV